MLARMLQRRGTAAQWEDVKNTAILAPGEIGLETDTGKFKVGDGITVWDALSYYLRDSDNDDIYSKLTSSQTFTGTQTLSPANATSIPLEVRGVDAQSAKLQRWRVGIGAPVEVASMDASGMLTANGADFNNDVDLNGNVITGVGLPVDPSDATNKQYVDDAIAGLAWKEAVHLIAHGAGSNVALTGTTGTLVIDSHAPLVQADSGLYRLLLTGQTTASQNGIYLYTDNGTTYTLTRTADADTPAELHGASVYVQEGTLYGTSSWVQSNYEMTTFAQQTWVQFSGAALITAGNGLTKDGNKIDVVAGSGLETTADSVRIATGGVTSAMIANGTIINEDVSNTAAIAATKISGIAVTRTDSGTVATEMIANGAITNDKLATNSVALTNMQDNSVGTSELVDGSVTSAKIANGTIVDADVNASAAIAQSKIANLTTDLSNKSNITHTHTLDNLSDVTITAPPSDRQVLQYKGDPINSWVNEVPSGGISVGAIPPSGAASGDAWFDSTDGSLYVYYDDGNAGGIVPKTTLSTVTANSSLVSGYRTRVEYFATYNSGPNTHTINYVYSIITSSGSFITNLPVVASLSIDGTSVFSVSQNYTFASNSTTVLSSGTYTRPYSSGVQNTVSLSAFLDGASAFPPELTISSVSSLSTSSGASAQWVQVKANSALEASILTRLSAVESRTTKLEGANAIRVLSMAERDSAFPSPVQGNTVFRADLGYEQKYFESFNAVTVPDGTTGTPGWYEVGSEKSAREIAHLAASNPANGIHAVSRRDATTSTALSSGTIQLTHFTPMVDLNITTLTFQSTGISSVMPTMARYGIYEVNSAETLMTLIGITENQATPTINPWMQNTPQAATLTTTTGLPVPLRLVAGKRYAVAMLVVGNSGGQFLSTPTAPGGGLGTVGHSPILASRFISQTNLPSTLTVSSGERRWDGPWALLT